MGAPTVLVTDGEQRCALAACRALAAVGFDVVVASARRPAAAQWTRACVAAIDVPDPRRDPAGFARRLRRELERRHCDVVLPGGDASLLAMSAHRAELEPLVNVGLPPHDVIERCIDKEVLVRHAQDAGLAPPVTHCCLDVADALDAADRLGYPVILKPTRSFSGRGGREHKPAVAADETDLAKAADAFGSPFLVQEFLGDAPTVSCAGVAVDGRVLGFVTARYARVWPPHRGSAACSETIRPPAGLRGRIARLVGSLGWQGIFEIELLERDDGGEAVIDFNTRVYGSLALAVCAGVNLPAIWCRYLLYGEIDDSEPAPGIRYRWEDGEILFLLRALMRGDVTAVRETARGGNDVVWAHYEPRDAGPLIARCAYLGRYGIEAAVKGTAARLPRVGRARTVRLLDS